MSNSTTASVPSDTQPDDVDVQIGFITAQLSSLPVGIRAILALLCVLIGLGLCTVSPYAARWGTQWGMGGSNAPPPAGVDDVDNGNKKKFRLAGGVLGIFTGSIGATYVMMLLTLAVLATQDDPSLSPWALLSICVIASIVGGILGGRWKVVSRLLLTFIGSVSLTLLFTTSFKIDRKLGRLIIFLILFVLFLVVAFIFSILPNHMSLQKLSNRISYSLLCSVTGAWLIFATGLDIFVKVGMMDAVTLLVSGKGVFRDGPLGDELEERERSNVVRWNEGRCKGLIAAMWLMIVAGTAFQLWRYSVIGDDPEESWNTYLGSLLSNEKALVTQARTHNTGMGNRAGFFTARQGWFKRLFMSTSRQKKRMMPATYMLPEEQGDHLSHGTPDVASSSSSMRNACPEHEDMREIRGAGLDTGGRRNAPAKYDSVGYSTVGLGLYDAERNDPRDAYYTNDLDGVESSLYAHNGRMGSQPHTPVPMYSPGIYASQAQAQIQRSGSEPSFNAVPTYTPHSASSSRAGHSSTLSGETMIERPGGEGVYSMRRIVEEPEEEDIHNEAREREAFIAPLSPRARERERVERGERSPPFTQPPIGRSTNVREVESVPIPATPSLVNAIRRVSEAQAQARAFRIKEQQAALSPSYRSESDIATSSHPPSTTTSPRLPESERIALRQAAIRRQASAEWWNEVERKASEQAQKERSSSPGSVSPRAGAAAGFSPRITSAPDERSMPWRNGSRGPAKY